MLKPEDFFELSDYAHRDIFSDIEFVWDVLKRLREYIEQVMRPGIHGTISEHAYLTDDNIWIGKGTIVEPGAYIQGPTIIGEHSIIRQGAYIRGETLIGDHCVVGHATEIKGSILLNHSNAPHFNYVGNSILGNHINLGAGTKLSNLKIADGIVQVTIEGTVFDTGLRKFGAVVGDHAGTGCNAVLNPGTLIGRGSLVYPCAYVSGYIPPNTLVKLRQTVELAEKR